MPCARPASRWGKRIQPWGFPPPTLFEPVLALHNFNRHRLSVALAVGYRAAAGPQEVQVPLSLAAGETRLLSLGEALAGVVPVQAHWASLELSYSDWHNGLVAALVSVSQDGAHSIRSVLNWVEGSGSDGWLWRADANYNTLIGILNTDSEEAEVAVSLDFYRDGQRRSYQLPNLVIPPRVSELVDVGQVIAAGLPDPDGEVIPAGVSWGGYKVRKVGQRIHIPIFTEALVFDRQRKSFETFYNTCCGPINVRVRPTQFIEPVGFNGQVIVEGEDSCSGITVTLTTSATFSSYNTGVATVGQHSGQAQGIAPGTTALRSYLQYYKGPKYMNGSCSPAVLDDDTPTQVMQAQLNCTPNSLTRGQSTSCTASVVNAPSGATISFEQWKFTAGSVTVNRSANPTSAMWSGKMVTSGAVSVKARVNGTLLPNAASSTVTVNKRNWHTNPASATQVPNGTIPGGTLPVPPQPNVPEPGDSGLGVSEEQTGDTGFSITPITDNGPNHGYAYYATQLSMSPFFFRYTINPDLENSGSAFSQHQCGDYNASTNPGGFISWSNLITQTRRHEYNSTTQSHHAFYKNAMNLASNNPGDYFEARVAAPGSALV